ncbi:MAG: exonuclease domain-containing protein [Acidimicrobiia bacterium]
MIDLETTGLRSKDRVVEIAIVTVDLVGRVVDEWTTLVNPGRDVGPTKVHGITASDVVNAPMFSDIADQVAARLRGACLVAHNLFGFDERMLRCEFERVVTPVVDLGRGIDTLRIAGENLQVACSAYGISLGGWHSALHDARATAQLFQLIGPNHEGGVIPVQADAVGPGSAAICPRAERDRSVVGAGLSHAPVLVSISAADVDEQPYLDLVSEVVEDWRITPDEREQLDDLASALGLSRTQQHAAHQQFIGALVSRALEQGSFAGSDFEQLLAFAQLLDVDSEFVVRKTEQSRRANVAVRLRAGMRVCFTGEACINGEFVDREVLEQHAWEWRMVAVPSVTKTTDVLVAGDTKTASVKATKARKYGIPIVGAEAFLAARTGDEVSGEAAIMRPRTVQLCSVCGKAVVLTEGARRRKDLRCAECSTDQSASTRLAVPEIVDSRSDVAPVVHELLPEAGWYGDPLQRFEYRFWDGASWTAHVATNGVQAFDPLGG